MKARVFIDAFAECLVNVAMARQHPRLLEALREISVASVVAKHGEAHANATRLTFDRLWNEANGVRQ